MAAIDITPVLTFMVDKKGSDLLFSTDAAIHMEIEGKNVPVKNQVMTPGMVKEMAYSLINIEQIQECEETQARNFTNNEKGIRINGLNRYHARPQIHGV